MKTNKIVIVLLLVAGVAALYMVFAGGGSEDSAGDTAAKIKADDQEKIDALQASAGRGDATIPTQVNTQSGGNPYVTSPGGRSGATSAVLAVSGRGDGAITALPAPVLNTGIKAPSPAVINRGGQVLSVSPQNSLDN